CKRRQRYKEARLRPGGGGSRGALPWTPGQKYRLDFLSVLLELLLHYVDVLTACGEVVETVRSVKHDLAASQAEQVFVGFTLLIVQYHNPAFVSLSAIRQA